MRSITIAQGEYYHIFNRGNHQQDIFHDDRDRARFLTGLLLHQYPAVIPQIGRVVDHYVKHRVFDSSLVLNDPYVALVCFALMPNHFHCIVHEREEGGIARYMQRLLNGYTKYFNTKREKSGHLFQGPFQAVHIEDDDQLVYLSAYIHRNPRALQGWRDREHEYPWSSYQDYVGENRWGALLSPRIVLDQVGRGAPYRRFVDRSGAKEHLVDAALHID